MRSSWRRSGRLWSLTTAKYRRRHLLEEARVLAGAFDLELPEFSELETNRQDAIDAVKALPGEVWRPRGTPEGRTAVRNLEKNYGVDSPTLDLLDRLAELQDGEEGETG